MTDFFIFFLGYTFLRDCNMHGVHAFGTTLHVVSLCDSKCVSVYQCIAECVMYRNNNVCSIAQHCALAHAIVSASSSHTKTCAKLSCAETATLKHA